MIQSETWQRLPTMTILIVSWQRIKQLEMCLDSLSSQTVIPEEVIVVWQENDHATALLLEDIQRRVAFNLKVLHSPDKGVVPAENIGLASAVGDVVAFLDDDAVAPPNWVLRHKAHYANPEIGAVGGPMMNFTLEGAPFPKRHARPIGIVDSFGRVIGNMYDLDDHMLLLPPMEVHHLVGANMSLRRCAFNCFERELKEYWQMFETDACLTVRKNGYRVIFDPGNPIHHFPTNTAFVGDRTGELAVKVFNPAFNHALIMSKHQSRVRSIANIAFSMVTGSVSSPGLLAFAVAVQRHGHLFREIRILLKTNQARIAGWRKGVELASSQTFSPASDRVRTKFS